METQENLSQNNPDTSLKTQTENNPNQEVESIRYPTYQEISQKLIQDPSSSHLFEKYQVTFNPENKISSLYELKKAMMEKYPRNSINSKWEHAQSYEDFTGLSIKTILNPQVLSEFVGIEQSIIVTETNLPDPFSQKVTIETLKEYISQSGWQYIDSQEQIDKLIANNPQDTNLSRLKKRIEKIGGKAQPDIETIIISPNINPKEHLFDLAHECCHLSQFILLSPEQEKLSDQYDFINNDEFEANIYALFCDPSLSNNPNLSYEQNLFATVTNLIKLSEISTNSKMIELLSLYDEYNSSKHQENPKSS